MDEDIEIITLDDQQTERLVVIGVDWDDNLDRPAHNAIFTTEVDEWCLENLLKSTRIRCGRHFYSLQPYDYHYEIDVEFGSEDDLFLFTLRWL